MHRYINIQVYVCFLKMYSMKPFFFIDNLHFYWMIKHSGLSHFIKWQQIISYLHLNLAVIIAITYFQITVSSLRTAHSFYLFMLREQINIIGIQTRQASACVYLQRNHGKHSLPLTLFSLLYTCNYLLINFQQNYWHHTSLNNKNSQLFSVEVGSLINKVRIKECFLQSEKYHFGLLFTFFFFVFLLDLCLVFRRIWLWKPWLRI